MIMLNILLLNKTAFTVKHVEKASKHYFNEHYGEKCNFSQ